VPALTISTALLSPTSRGTVGLDNANPLAAPILNPNWLHTDIDLVSVSNISEGLRAQCAFSTS
jgi:hypothetical protein